MNRTIQGELLGGQRSTHVTFCYDRFTKRRLYQEVEIPDYWIVDPDQRLVELWTPDRELPDIERGEVTWHPAGAAQAFTLNLEDLFRPI